MTGQQIVWAPRSHGNTERQAIEYRNAKIRISDFNEAQGIYNIPLIGQQASRCAGCGTSGCNNGKSSVQIGCPQGNDIPGWLDLVRQGRHKDASNLAFSTNLMPDITGFLCPQDALCEGACTLVDKGALTIGNIERFVGDMSWENGWVPSAKPAYEIDKHVSVIGMGPSGYAAAYMARIAGYSVTMYDGADQPGGLLTRGIPGFKVENFRIYRYFDALAKAGVEIKTGTAIGHDNAPSFAKIAEKSDAIIMAVGHRKPNGAGMKGNAVDRLKSAVSDFLIPQNKTDEGIVVPGYSSLEGKRVLVLGGGSTAQDCLRTAIRRGASEAIGIYRGSEENMKGASKDVALAREEKAEHSFFSQPIEINENTDGSLAVTCVKTEMVDGRAKPIEGSEFTVNADEVVVSYGFGAENLTEKFGIEGANLKKNGAFDIVEAGNIRNHHNPHASGMIGTINHSNHKQTFVLATGETAMGRSGLVAQCLSGGKQAGEFTTKLLHGDKKAIIIANRAPTLMLN